MKRYTTTLAYTGKERSIKSSDEPRPRKVPSPNVWSYIPDSADTIPRAVPRTLVPGISVVQLRHRSATFHGKSHRRKQDLSINNPRTSKYHEKRVESQLTVALELIPAELTWTQNGFCRQAQRPCKRMLSRGSSLPTNIVVRAGHVRPKLHPCVSQTCSQDE